MSNHAVYSEANVAVALDIVKQLKTATFVKSHKPKPEQTAKHSFLRMYELNNKFGRWVTKIMVGENTHGLRVQYSITLKK